MDPRPQNTKKPIAAAPRSVTRLLGLLGTLAQLDNGMSLAELSGMLQSPKSSLLVLLRPLVAEGYLIHESGRYRLGPSTYRLASTISVNSNLNSLIRPYINELATLLSESVYLAVLDRDTETCSYIEGIDCQQAVRFVLPLGQARSLHTTAAGRLLLAYQDKAFIDSYLKALKPRPADDLPTITRDELKKKLVGIREQAYAVTIDEGHLGASGIAAPILNPEGQLSAALLVAMPTQRYRQKGDIAIKALVAVATRASGELRSAAPRATEVAKNTVRASKSVA